MLRFALKNLKTKLTRAVLASVAVVLCSTIALVTYNTANQMEDGVISTAGYYDTIVGPEGSPLQLALSSMFFVENPLGTISYRHYEALKENPSVKEIYPFAAGDSYRSAPIIGTIPEYLNKYQMASGQMFSEPEEVVLGYNIGRPGVLEVGDKFFGVHGLAGDGHVHGDFEYQVVGILSKTGTALDNAIFATVESVWMIHDHDHDHDYEWAGAFGLFNDEYKLAFEKVNGSYADPTMDIAVLFSRETGHEAIEDTEGKAEALLPSTPVKIVHGDTIIPGQTLYKLEFDQTTDASTFTLKIETPGTYVLFAEHFPSEFENELHFFKCADGDNVEPTTEKYDADHHEHGTTGDLVSLIIKTDSLAAHNQLVLHFQNVPGVQAINPAAVLRELLNNLSLGRDILYMLATIIIFLTAVIIYVTTASFIEDSKKDIQIMRLVGIKRKTIFSMFLVQTAFIAALSIAVSFMLSLGALFIINRFTSQNLGILIDAAKHYPGELVLVFSVFSIIIISAVVSIIPTYKHDPLEVK